MNKTSSVQNKPRSIPWAPTGSRRGCEVVAVAAAGAPVKERSWREGRAVGAGAVNTVADGLAICVPVPGALAMIREAVGDVVPASDEAMIAAMQLLHREAGLVAEPAGAAGMASILEHLERRAGRRVATILCGSNVVPELQGGFWVEGRVPAAETADAPRPVGPRAAFGSSGRSAARRHGPAA